LSLSTNTISETNVLNIKIGDNVHTSVNNSSRDVEQCIGCDKPNSISILYNTNANEIKDSENLQKDITIIKNSNLLFY